MSYSEPPPFDDDWVAPQRPVPEPEPEEPISDRLRRVRLRMQQREGIFELTKEEQALVQSLSRRPEVRPLSELLEEPDEEHPSRIEGISDVGDNVLLIGGYKVGKTSMMLNIARSLLDGAPLFNRFEVDAPLDGNLIFLNYELPEQKFKRWLQMQKIAEAHRVIPINLRGRSLKPQQSDDFEWLAEQIARFEGEAVLADPLRGLIKGDPNRGDVMSEFIQTIDELKFISGATDWYMSAHSGHPRSITRNGVQTNLWAAGHSSLMGWGDRLITVVQGKGDARMLSTQGRYDDEVPPEVKLSFDPKTKWLKYEGMTGRQVKAESTSAEGVEERILTLAMENPGITTNGFRKELKGVRAEEVNAAIKGLVEEGSLRFEEGLRGAHEHFVVEDDDD